MLTATGQTTSAPTPEDEYRTIEAALLETARGRWFLAEHSRRARRIDTLTLQEAIGKLQSSLREPPALVGQLHNEIAGLQDLLRETRAALVSKPKEPPGQAPGTVSGPGGILAAAEGIHELAWSLHEQEIDVETCEKIARQASSIYALSVRHASESERVRTLTVSLDKALVRLDGLLETIGHETQFDTFSMPPDDESNLDEAAAAAAAVTREPVATPMPIVPPAAQAPEELMQPESLPSVRYRDETPGAPLPHSTPDDNRLSGRAHLSGPDADRMDWKGTI
ncbi:MAG TPA: hypothetical protein VMX97_07265 [Hyphomicrobiaceae bacterium]|nr:hypothetical protein [Hyphomicrobiaceae bacterium]